MLKKLYNMVDKARSWAIIPVSYTHLDVYKRQGLQLIQTALCSI